MGAPLSDLDRLKVRVVCVALLGSALVLLAFCWFVTRGGASHAVPALAWVSVALALASPFLAAALDLSLSQAEPLLRHLLPFALLQGAAMLCGVALLVGGSDAPLPAAALPVLAMLKRFPAAPGL